MPRTKPPLRTDHVGSLLRLAALKTARAKRERGKIGADRAQDDRRPRDQALGLIHSSMFWGRINGSDNKYVSNQNENYIAQRQ